MSHVNHRSDRRSFEGRVHRQRAVRPGSLAWIRVINDLLDTAESNGWPTDSDFAATARGLGVLERTVRDRFAEAARSLSRAGIVTLDPPSLQVVDVTPTLAGAVARLRASGVAISPIGLTLSVRRTPGGIAADAIRRDQLRRKTAAS
jgi:hypothetical protein